MLTLLLILIPLGASFLALFFRGEKAKYFALLASLVNLAVGIYAAIHFQKNAEVQFGFDYAWVPAFGIAFKAGMDGISLLLVLLTVFLVPLIILSSFRHNYTNPAAFFALILLMEAGLVGVFTARDAFLFYVFWEAALIPVYFLAAVWGGEHRIAVTFKFFIYTIAGSLLMLFGILYLYFQTPAPHSFDIGAFYNLAVKASAQGWLFWCFFIAFAIKMPIFPFHTWQPDTYAVSPTPATMLLAGIMLKMGIYGAIRWLLPVLPEGVGEWGRIALVLSTIGVVYGAALALVQKDMKRLLAYSSLGHVGLIAAGVFTLSRYGLQGSMVQMLSHGLTVVGLFFVAEIITRRTNSREIDHSHGMAHDAPRLAVFFLIVLLGSVALPLTSGFIGEFLILLALFQKSAWLAAFAGLSVILGAVYMFSFYRKTMLGEKRSGEKFTDLTFSEMSVFIPIAIFIFWIGIYPQTFLDLSAPAVDQLLTLIHRK
ncbi:MAG: NADH-quinone oxidoreductase subunit M [Spirochaetia bacterium]|nr:NADH-quinone oxidoreductase subunit M [Spirochaetia bacterium]